MRRVILLCAIAACALLTSALASTASAAEPGTWNVNGKPVVGAEKFELRHKSYAGKYQLLGTPFGIAAHINCSSVTALGSIKAGGLGEAHFGFTGCEVVKPANCSVKEPIEVAVNFSLLKEGTPATFSLNFTPQGEAFVTFTLQGEKCAIKTPFPITGSQTCNVPGAGTEAVGHLLECLTSGSNLKAGGKVATFQGNAEGIELAGGQSWSAS